MPNTVEEYVEDLAEVRLTNGWRYSQFGQHIGFILTWSSAKLGFGEASYYVKDDIGYCDDECMWPQFIEAVLIKYARSLTLTHK